MIILQKIKRQHLFLDSLFAAVADETVFALQIRNWNYVRGFFFASHY
jgi:acid stress-induced BolA-like protein IbaG/YrbA